MSTSMGRSAGPVSQDAEVLVAAVRRPDAEPGGSSSRAGEPDLRASERLGHDRETSRAVLVVVLLLCSLTVCFAQRPYCGIGGLSLPSAETLPESIAALQRDGINHLQCSVDVKAPDVRRRIEAFHEAGFTVYAYATAFIEQVDEREDYQVLADGTHKQGTVCPRSARRAAEMLEATKAVVDTGADGMIWDFVTVESRTYEACFCPACVAAFNAAAGTTYDREELVKAIHEGGAALQTWLKVREESTTTALANLSRRVAAYAGEEGASFRVGGYVVNPGSDLGMDTVALRSSIGTLAPMIYQGSGKAPLGWMKRALEVYTAMPGEAEIIECVDAGFFVDEPVSELIATSWDCLRAGIDGYAFWPVGKMSAEDMAGVRGVNQLATLVYRPLRAGDQDEARAGLSTLLGAIGRAVAQYGSEADREQWTRYAPVVRNGAQAPDVGSWIEEPGNLEAMEAALNLYARANAAELHANDVRVTLPPYQVTISEQADAVEIAGPDWVLRQDGRALNFDDLEFAGLCGDASTDAYELGLLRTRVTGWFDPWGSPNQTTVTRRDRESIVLLTEVKGNGCLIQKETTVRVGSCWLDVTLSVENTGEEARSGRLWLWNGIGIPGFLETGDGAWEDDETQVLEDGTLLCSDEGRFVAVRLEPEFWKTSDIGGDGSAHAFKEIRLEPGERVQTRVGLAIGAGYPQSWEAAQAEAR